MAIRSSEQIYERRVQLAEAATTLPLQVAEAMAVSDLLSEKELGGEFYPGLYALFTLYVNRSRKVPMQEEMREEIKETMLGLCRHVSRTFGEEGQEGTIKYIIDAHKNFEDETGFLVYINSAITNKV